ncbi:MAG: ABC transporter permease, partial [Gammaproteobacteria bacterium]
MPEIAQAFSTAVTLILGGDPNLAEVVLLSLRVSLSAVFLATLIGFPLGAVLAVSRFPGRKLFIV